MLNVENLHLVGSVISDTFLQSDLLSNAKPLPSLRHLYLYHFTLQNDDDWAPPIPPEVVREIENLVDEFTLGDRVGFCLTGAGNKVVESVVWTFPTTRQR